MGAPDGNVILPQDRPAPETMTEREMLIELVRTARVIETAVIQLSKNPMFQGMGSLLR